MERLLISVTPPEASSEVLIGRGLPEPLLPARADRSLSVVLTQPGAAPTAARVATALGGAPILEVPDRDDAKTVAVAERVYGWMAGLGVGRHDTVVGVGGGALTDLAGFVAATWLRGIEVVLVPTTLLAAVDAAIGGKTGLNLEGKNLIGAFHLASRVVTDLDVLAEIPAALRLEGIAESLKAGLVGDAGLVRGFVEHGTSLPLEEVVGRAARVKVEVVNTDFREGGRRAILNFGHTVGHAVETAGGLAHGLAVSVGMVAAASLSESRYGFPCSWLADLLFSLGLPVAAGGLPVNRILDLIGRDKKRTSQGIRMVLLRDVADPVIDLVAEAEIVEALHSVGIA